MVTLYLKQDGARSKLGEVHCYKHHLAVGTLDDVLLARARLASPLGRSEGLLSLPQGHLCEQHMCMGS